MDDNKGLQVMVLSLICFFVCAAIAYIQRGYFAFGGEWLTLIPGYVAAFQAMAGCYA